MSDGMPVGMHSLGCRRGRKHDFDWYSGWCRNGCGNRNDGRTVSRYGDVINPGPEYTTEQLEPIRERLERRNRKR